MCLQCPVGPRPQFWQPTVPFWGPRARPLPYTSHCGHFLTLSYSALLWATVCPVVQPGSAGRGTLVNRANAWDGAFPDGLRQARVRKPLPEENGRPCHEAWRYNPGFGDFAGETPGSPMSPLGISCREIPALRLTCARGADHVRVSKSLTLAAHGMGAVTASMTSGLAYALPRWQACLLSAPQPEKPGTNSRGQAHRFAGKLLHLPEAAGAPEASQRAWKGQYGSGTFTRRNSRSNAEPAGFVTKRSAIDRHRSRKCSARGAINEKESIP